MSVANNVSQAVTDILVMFTNVWGGLACDIPGSPFKAPSSDTVWARWRIQHETGGQNSLANVVGKRRFNRGGTVFIQIFTPLNNGVEMAYDLAEIVVGAYEGKRTASGAWFRNIRMNEVDNETDVAGMQQINVLVDFDYDQIH
jgi:hypothetical protein